MAPLDLPARYKNTEDQEVHRKLFANSLTQPLKQILPPGLDRAQFDSAIAEFKEVVGADAVFTGDALIEYVDPYELWEVDERRKLPSAAVCPKSDEELRGILRVANKFTVPLWTFSCGKNLGYGGPAPRLNGSVALDLHRMNKIIEVNEEFAYAVVEPGVTFTELYNYCAERKLRVWPSVPSLGWGSVVGNTLDRGTGFTPTATHHQNIAGLEVMLADGDVVRTGQFAISKSDSAHLSKFTFGPSIEGLFLQSNLGVVTKLGIWVFPQPEAYMACSFDVPDIEDIEDFVNVFGEFRRNGLLRDTVYVNNIIEKSSAIKRVDLWDGPGPIPEWRVKEIQKQFDFGYWNATFGLYGHELVIKAQYEQVKKIVAEKLPKGRLQGKLFVGKDGKGLEAASVEGPYGAIFVGVPSLWSLPMVGYRLPKDGSGIGAHADYSSIIPSAGKKVLDWVKTAKAVCEEHGFDLFCDFFMHERHLIFVTMMLFDKSNADHRKTVDAIFQSLFEEGKKRGFSKYRSHVNHMDMVADLFDFNDHAYRRFVEKIKDTIDPKGILSPGKQGIWPEAFRHHRGLPGPRL